MKLRNFLILSSLVANVVLVWSMHKSLRRSAEARAFMQQQSGEVTRLREAFQRRRSDGGALSASGLGMELALLQKIKMSVAAEVARAKKDESRCAKGSAGGLGQLINAMSDYRKRVDALGESNRKDAAKKAELAARVEEEARKMKEELIVLCSR